MQVHRGVTGVVDITSLKMFNLLVTYQGTSSRVAQLLQTTTDFYFQIVLILAINACHVTSGHRMNAATYNPLFLLSISLCLLPDQIGRTSEVDIGHRQAITLRLPPKDRTTILPPQFLGLGLAHKPATSTTRCALPFREVGSGEIECISLHPSPI
jgi:hypothetical protein